MKPNLTPALSQTLRGSAVLLWDLAPVRPSDQRVCLDIGERQSLLWWKPVGRFRLGPIDDHKLIGKNAKRLAAIFIGPFDTNFSAFRHAQPKVQKAVLARSVAATDFDGLGLHQIARVIVEVFKLGVPPGRWLDLVVQ